MLSISLVPDWTRINNEFEDKEYLKNKVACMKASKEKFNGISNLHIEDFYVVCKMEDDHRAYMHGLMALGSNDDMIKTLAIINNASHCRHLQINSNTIVPSLDDLYNQTFNATEQKDGINASYYDQFYISAHNKMVYTTPTGEIAKSGRLVFDLSEWCKAHKNDGNNEGQDKHKDKNSIYARVFTKALDYIHYDKEYTAGNTSFYPATLSLKVYWLTDLMATAVKGSWNESKGIYDNLKTLLT